jgi:hypothetical protein
MIRTDAARPTLSNFSAASARTLFQHNAPPSQIMVVRSGEHCQLAAVSAQTGNAFAF